MQSEARDWKMMMGNEQDKTMLGGNDCVKSG